MTFTMRLAFPLLLITFLSGCGGGDGSSNAPPMPPTPPTPPPGPTSPVMPSGFHYPTTRVWTGDNGGAAGNPKQPWNDSGSGELRIFGYLEESYEQVVGERHAGMDIRASRNAPIYAICDGAIDAMWKQVPDDPTFWAIIVKHFLADGSVFFAIYGHCETLPDMLPGTPIVGGQQIGVCREDPNWHLHLGINTTGGFDAFGRIPIGEDPEDYGWMPPRTWLLAHAPRISLQ